ncbi:MAG: LytTR family transcriptional regulator [Bacteroidetes bacterium]|jgi:two-component system LytT family response regulator|nr:MAG: LytTR family transcriptional regulator [Bacteroidota bacterium]
MYSVNNTIMIPHHRGLAVVDIHSIVRVEAVSSYSRLILGDGSQVLVSKVLKQMESMLAGKGFVRVHRSHLVNTAWIRTYNFYEYKVVLRNNEEINISRRKKKELHKKMADQKEAVLKTLRFDIPSFN